MRLPLIASLWLVSLLVSAQTPANLLQSWSYAREIQRSPAQTTDYLLGLGAMQKIGGRWRHKDSAILSGELERVTWQVADGFTAAEAWDWYVARLPGSAELLFECSGRDCGSSAQWADRVFQQRVLYGHDERQQYGVWRWSEAGERITLVVYAVDRANRRHYLHVDIMREAAQ